MSERWLELVCYAKQWTDQVWNAWQLWRSTSPTFRIKRAKEWYAGHQGWVKDISLASAEPRVTARAITYHTPGTRIYSEKEWRRLVRRAKKS